MAEVYTQQPLYIDWEAAADLSAKQYTVVTLSSGKIAAQTSAGAGGIGILDGKPTAGQAGAVCVGGVVKAKAGAAITEGARLSNDTSGRVVTITSTDSFIGIALTSCSNANELISMLVIPSGAVEA